MSRPRLSVFTIFNMCFGFLGVQYAYALQNSSVSRIFQTLGADIQSIPALWAAAPLTGLIVQPIIGYLSDKTWTRFGRRRPYMLIGAVLTTLSLFVFPHSASLWFAAGMLWILDSSVNVANEPFRAFVGDSLPEEQRAFGFVTQSFFIGIGAVLASALPYILTNYFEVSNTAPAGKIPDAVKYAFYTGASIIIFTCGWTVFTTKEYSPKQLKSFGVEMEGEEEERAIPLKPGPLYSVWIIVGLVGVYLIQAFSLNQSLYILTGGFTVFGVLMFFVAWLEKQNKTNNGFYHIMYDVNRMPRGMRHLAVVQFFSWFALFTMWIYITPAVSAYHFGATDTSGKLYNDGADWAGILLAIYNVFTVISAFFIPVLCDKIGLKKGYSVCLVLGAIGYLGVILVKEPNNLWIPMIGIGVAWGAILALPYAMLSMILPQNKFGVYIGIFNFFITIPQLVAASLLGVMIKYLFAEQAIYAFVIGAISLMFAAVANLRVCLEKD